MIAFHISLKNINLLKLTCFSFIVKYSPKVSDDIIQELYTGFFQETTLNAHLLRTVCIFFFFYEF